MKVKCMVLLVSFNTDAHILILTLAGMKEVKFG